MAGHTISFYLHERGHEVTTVTRKPFPYFENIIGDVNEVSLLNNVVTTGKYDVIVNCIGILNQSAEIDKRNAVFLNSYLPHYLSDLTKDSQTKIIHMSTDCVFSGKTGNYDEYSLRDGETFYDRSKALGELENDKDLTFRNSIIGPDMNRLGIGLFNWFMKQKGEINGYTKAIWTGVTTLTLAKAIEKAARYNLCGLYNLVNNETISKYELIQLFNESFKDGQLMTHKSEDVALNKSLINTRNDFDFAVPSYESMIIEMKAWVNDHRDLYPHYFE